MDDSVRALHAKVQDLYSEDAFTARLAELSGKFGGLLDDATLALYVVDEHGRNEGAVVTISECPDRPEATVRVTVGDFEPVREFQRGEGTGRVRNVRVTDRSGEARLTFWDRDVEKTEDGTLSPGDVVKVVNARVKDSRFGLELHVTPWTALEVEGAPDPATLKLMNDTRPDYDPVSNRASGTAGTPTDAGPQTPVQTTLAAAAGGGDVPVATVGDARPGDTLHVARVTVDRVHPTRPFRRPDGSTGFVANVDVRDDSGRAVLTLWDEAVKGVQNLPDAARLEVTDLYAKARGGRVELHATRDTRITRRD